MFFRDWLTVFSPPIIPQSEQLAGPADKTSHLASQGENSVYVWLISPLTPGRTGIQKQKDLGL